MKIRVVLDTNVIVSALTFGGKPQIIYELLALNSIFTAYSSENALGVLLRVLERKFEYSSFRLQEVEKNIRENFNIIGTGKIPNVIESDPSDNKFLAIADSARADYIISGDRHLLELKKYKKTEIITPTKFLEEVSG